MRLLPVLVLTTPLVAVAACGRGSQENVPPADTPVDAQAVEPPQTGQIKVHVSCREEGFGTGARITPWRARLPLSESASMTWELLPASLTVLTELKPVDPERWPFAEDPITWDHGRRNVAVKSGPAPDLGEYKYQLRIVCPAEAETRPDTIVIDPLVIIDPSVRPDTPQANPG
jgi:hypothetical protein